MKYLLLIVLAFVVGCTTPFWGGVRPYYKYYAVNLDSTSYMIFNAARNRLNKVIGYEYIGVTDNELSADLLYSVNIKEDIPGYYENLLGMYYTGNFYTKDRIRILDDLLPATEYKIALHEMMHALGLDHNSNEKSIMYSILFNGGESQDITQDDEKEILMRVLAHNKIKNEYNIIERVNECRQAHTILK